MPKMIALASDAGCEPATAALTIMTTSAATPKAAPMPWVIELAISSPNVY